MSTGELTSAQVADYLGVKVQTVYAYVSRGVLAPVRREPGTGSLFALADVQALLGGGRSGRRGRRAATSDDVRTTITEVTAGTLAYRGHDVADLVGRWSFEQVRSLLVQNVSPFGERGPSMSPVGEGAVVTGTSHQVVRPAPDEVTALEAVMAALPARTTALDRFKHAVLVAATTDAGRHDRSPRAVARAGERAVAFMALALPGASTVATAAAGRAAPGTDLADSVPDPVPDPSLAATLTAYLPGCPAHLIDAALVLLADHDLAVSTTAVRVAVSSGADAYSALLAGLAAADSPLHVAASLRSVDWLTAALVDPHSALDAALAGEMPPGFGHLVYTEEDPRAQLLLGLLEPYAPPGTMDAIRLIERELLERRGWVLTVDVALALLVRCFDLPRDAGVVIFACARTAGWTAHAIEELAEPGMRFRLRGVYSGARRPGVGGATGG